MIYYLVLMNGENIVEICSYDNYDAQQQYIKILSEREYSMRIPMYTHVIPYSEVR